MYLSLSSRFRSVVVRERDKRCLPLDRKVRLGCGKNNDERFTSLPQKYHICYGLNAKRGRICVAWVWNREGTKKLANGKQHSVWFVQKHTTPKRLNSPYLFRTILGFFSRRSRPIRSTENYFAQIWNQRIQGENLWAYNAYTCMSTTERNRFVA